ncbi:MAG: nucleotidyl transferase AbiEii/AbiGii toxin family protein [Prolixibacteraceae bacterium]|nr:nucleotidyl transferase AbiEii/AbiGii toxin family protein [Prolixibacteraceae bacterium]
MLFKEPVAPSTLKIIQKLFSIDDLYHFDLVGGTALALQIGHRISVDIDMFTKSVFDNKQLKECLLENFQGHDITFDYEAKNTLIGSIDQIKVDFIRHSYPTIKETKAIEGIRLCSLEDIAAMKVSAITDNGTRIKDFVDLYYLLHHFKLDEIIQFYEQKYQSENSFHALKSITYFNDLDIESINNINFIKNKRITFEKLRSILVKETEDYLKKIIGRK